MCVCVCVCVCFCFAQQWQWDQDVLRSRMCVRHWTSTHICVFKRPKIHLHEKQRCRDKEGATAALKTAVFILCCALWRTLCNYSALCMLQAILSCMADHWRCRIVTKYIYSSTVLRYLVLLLQYIYLTAPVTVQVKFWHTKRINK